jgi:prophage tail gpP-like protein
MSSIAETSPTLAANLLASAKADAQRARMRSKDPLAFTLILNGREVPVVAGHLTRSIDNVADQWTAEISWTPGADPDLDKAVRFRSYADSRVYLGASLQNSGRLYNVENELTKSGRTKRLEGASYTADLVDSSVSMDAMQHGLNPNTATTMNAWIGGSVWNWCKASLPPGFEVKTDLGDPGAFYVKPFQLIDMQLTETYAQVITRLAFQRGMLVNSDINGNLFLTQPNQKQEPLCTLREGDEIVIAWKLKISGRELWYDYIVYSESGYGAIQLDSSNDSNVPTTRQLAIVATLTDIGGLKQTSRYKRNQQIVKALTFSLPISGWYTPKGALWQPNKLVTVVSETLEIPKGFTFLIRSVDFDYTKAGCTAILHLIPPDAYSLEESPNYFGIWQE